MVALRWCEEDEEEQQQEVVSRLTVAGGSPSGASRGSFSFPRERSRTRAEDRARSFGEGSGPSFGAV